MSREFPLNQIVTGDARELSKAIPDASIDLVFCDPPYLRKNIDDGIYAWIDHEAARVLKPGGFCLVYCGTYWLRDALLQMGHDLTFFWEYRILYRDGYTAGIHWQRRTKPGCTPLLAFCQGHGRPSRAVIDCYKGAGADKSFHKWGQDAYSVQYYLDCFSQPGEIVADFFCGGGTIPAVCKQLGRHSIAFEIDEGTATLARKRVEHVQMPLPGLIAEQTTFEMGVSA